MGVDGVRGSDRAARWRRLFLLDAGLDGAADLIDTRVDADELDTLTRKLTSVGATVTVVDRPTGKVKGRSARRRRAA